MKVRYKKTGSEAEASRFNMHALAEVLTGDDSASISDLDVWLSAHNAWKDMHHAFKDRDLITDNDNSCFFEPSTDEDRAHGFAL